MTTNLFLLKKIWLSPKVAIRYLFKTSRSNQSILPIFILILIMDVVGDFAEVEAFLSSHHLSLGTLPSHLIPFYREGLIHLPILTCIYFFIGGLISWLITRAICKGIDASITLREVYLFMLWPVLIPQAFSSILDGLFYSAFPHTSFPIWIITGIFRFWIVCAACSEWATLRNRFVVIPFVVLTLMFSLLRFAIQASLLTDKIVLA